MVDKETLKILRKAQKRIQKRWCQGDYTMKNGAVCAVGALEKASGKYFHTDCYKGIEHEDEHDKAYKIIQELVEEREPDTDIEEWNDRGDRKKKEVVCLFQEAIEKVIDNG